MVETTATVGERIRVGFREREEEGWRVSQRVGKRVRERGDTVRGKEEGGRERGAELYSQRVPLGDRGKRIGRIRGRREGEVWKEDRSRGRECIAVLVGEDKREGREMGILYRELPKVFCVYFFFCLA